MGEGEGERRGFSVRGSIRTPIVCWGGSIVLVGGRGDGVAMGEGIYGEGRTRGTET
jgi:hypothetical protein